MTDDNMLAALLRVSDKIALIYRHEIRHTEDGYFRVTRLSSYCKEGFTPSHSKDKTFLLSPYKNKVLYDALILRLKTPQCSAVKAYYSNQTGYLFKVGNDLITIVFTIDPEPELLKLMSLSIDLIFQKQIKKVFKDMSVYNPHIFDLIEKLDKRDLLYRIISERLDSIGDLFDLEECLIAIRPQPGVYSFTRGSIHFFYDLAGKCTISISNNSHIDKVILEENKSREFLSAGVEGSKNFEIDKPLFIDFYFKSRSEGSVNPYINESLHHFIKLFIENITKFIDMIIPFDQVKTTKKILKRRFIFESLRSDCYTYGDNLHKIFTNCTSLLYHLLGIRNIFFCCEDPIFLKILKRSIGGPQKRNYGFKLHPPSRFWLEKNNLVSLPISRYHQSQYKVSLYFRMPSSHDKLGESYLDGTFLKEELLASLPNVSKKRIELLLKGFLDGCLNSTAAQTERHFEEYNRENELGIPEDYLKKAIQQIIADCDSVFHILGTVAEIINSSIGEIRANRDSLTGLLNRQSFSDKVNFYTDNLFMNPKGVGLIFLDMDTFKIYNDTVSHFFGDKLLIHLASILLGLERSASGDNLVASRFGGDEFCVAVRSTSMEELVELGAYTFHAITTSPVPVSFLFNEKAHSKGLSIDFISFLERMVHPDIGGQRGQVSGYVEKKDMSPRGWLSNIFLHMLKTEGEGSTILELIADSLVSETLNKELNQKVVEVLGGEIRRKLIQNYIFKSIDTELSEAIDLFLDLCLKDQSFKNIRLFLVKKFGSQLNRTLYLRISMGLAHSQECGFPSFQELFHLGDNRASRAKQLGKNRIVGINDTNLIFKVVNT